MSLTVTSRRFPDAQPGREDDQGRRYYTEVFEVDQTDGGPLAAGVAVAAAATAVMTGDPLPLRGDPYSYAGTTDLDSYALSYSWQRPQPTDLPTRWHITVNYGPADGIDPGQLAENDPLAWPTEYWIEWGERSEVIEEARNVEALDQIGRAADTLGPVVNACGQETSEPLMRTVYYPILCCQKSYATLEEIIALNDAYQNTTNDASFFGAPARTAKYLLTENSRIQRTQGVSYYTGITRIAINAKTWDRPIVNNGWGHFKKDGAGYILGDAGLPNGNPFADAPKLFRNLVFDDAEADENDVPASEPMNLALDGTLVPIGELSEKITYRDLDEVDYDGIGIGG